MKRLLMISMILLIPLTAIAGKNQPPPSKETIADKNAAKAAVANCVDNIEVLDGVPERPYTILSIVSEKPLWEFTSHDKLLRNLKKKACKLGADALIKYECHEVTEGGSRISGSQDNVRGRGSIESVPVCTGTAVKWK